MSVRVLQRLWFWMVVWGGLVATGWLISAAPAEPGRPGVDGAVALFGWMAVTVGTPVLLFLCAIAAEDALERRTERRLT